MSSKCNSKPINIRLPIELIKEIDSLKNYYPGLNRTDLIIKAIKLIIYTKDIKLYTIDNKDKLIEVKIL